MSEVTKIENSSVGGAEVTHVEASQENDIGGVSANTGFETGGQAAAAVVHRLPQAPLGNFLQRLTKYGVVNLATTDVQFNTIAFFDPWLAMLNNAVIAPKITQFTYVRGTIEVEFTVNVAAGCYGLYYLVAIPNGSGNWGFIDTDTGFNVHVAECVPHVMIDIASSTKGKLVLPWINWNDYGTIGSTGPDGPTGMWRIELICYHPLAQGNGAVVPTGTVVLYVKGGDDIEMTIPRQQMGRDKPSRALGTFAKAATGLGGIPVIGTLARPLAAGAAAASSFLDWLGFTRTTEQRTPQPIVHRAYSNLANADAADTSEIAAMSVSNTLSIDPRFHSTTVEDEMSFDYLVQKYVMVGVYDWTKAASSGDTLAVIPVTPFFSRIGTGLGAVMTMAGFLGLPFQFWRADMEYKIVIPFCKFHRGALQVSWSPENVFTADVTNNQFNHIFDVVPGKMWEFTVGFASARPMLSCSTPAASTDGSPQGGGANGFFRIGVVNPLECAVETADTKIFVFARAKPGAQFGVPRTMWQPRDTEGVAVTADFATTVRLQTGALGDDVAETVSVELVPRTGAFPVKDVSLGEEIHSARMLMQKFAHDRGASYSLGNSEMYAVALNHVPMIPSDDQFLNYFPQAGTTATFHTFSWFGWYASLFVGVACSTRYKVVNTGASSSAIAVFAGTTDGGRNYSGQLSGSFGQVAPVQVVTPGNAVEVTVPYYFLHKYLPTLGRMSATTVIEGTREGRLDIIYVTPPTATALPMPSVAVYYAAGPDIRVQTSRFPRTVIFDYDALATGVAPVFGNVPGSPPS